MFSFNHSTRSEGKYAVIASGAVVAKAMPDYATVGDISTNVIGQRAKKDYKYKPYHKLHVIRTNA